MTSQLRQLAIPAYVLLIGLFCAAAVAIQLAAVTAEKDAERFEYAVAQTQDDLEGRIDTYVALLEAGAAMLAAVDLDLSQAEFRAFTERLDLAGRYPGVQGVGYSVRVRADSEALVRRTMRAQGMADFDIWPDAPDENGEHHAILYLEPLDDRNRQAIGYNMYSEAVRRAAMERARDTGRPAASGVVELVQDSGEDPQAGFLIYVPVYEAGDPGNVAERRERLAGFVYSPFRSDDLMRGVFGDAPNPRLHLAVYDGAQTAGQLLHVSEGGRPVLLGGGDARFRTDRTLSVGGRTWTVDYATRPEFELSSSRQLVPLVLAAGVAVTLVLAFAAWRQARTSALARRRTRELEVFNALGAAMAAEMDQTRLLEAAAEAGAELTGAEGAAAFYGETAIQWGRSFEALAPESGQGQRLLTPVLQGAHITRLENIAQDDPQGGEPAPKAEAGQAHSFLAAPVLDRHGRARGGLAFAHSRLGRFTPRDERLAAGLAAQAAIAMDNARLWDEMRAEVDHRKLLMEELNHRVKNTLATVQSMAAQTLRHTESRKEFRDAFQARLIGLSSTHNLLTAGDWKGAALRELLRAELSPFEHAGSERVTMEGPELRLRPAEATSLGMAFHELTTNAVKYGALSRPEGRVEVRWSVDPGGDDKDRLRLDWREHGGPPVKPPERRGFGSRLIEGGLVGRHGGEAQMRFDPEGLSCHIEMPLTLAPAEAA